MGDHKKIQNTQSPKGQLFVVATPIGNLSDLSHRATQVLSDAAVIAAEDTRRTRKLLTSIHVSKPLVRCDRVWEEKASQRLLSLLASGHSVALVTDAGTPGISDPGTRLAAKVWEHGFAVIPIPGPSAITTALSISGFSPLPFHFYGFLPKKGKDRQRIISAMTLGPDTSVCFEAPYRLIRTLDDLAQTAPSRMALVGREMTKHFEEYRRDTLMNLATSYVSQVIRGECTIVIAALPRQNRPRRTKKWKEEE